MHPNKIGLSAVVIATFFENVGSDGTVKALLLCDILVARDELSSIWLASQIQPMGPCHLAPNATPGSDQVSWRSRGGGLWIGELGLIPSSA